MSAPANSRLRFDLRDLLLVVFLTGLGQLIAFSMLTAIDGRFYIGVAASVIAVT